MIKGFGDKRTEKLFNSQRPKGFPSDLIARSVTKLHRIHAATCIDDLRIPPSNHLEILKGNRAGQHSIRINNQWRICFRWEGGDAHQVEVTDYH